jgi:hypothetical protein
MDKSSSPAGRPITNVLASRFLFPKRGHRSLDKLLDKSDKFYVLQSTRQLHSKSIREREIKWSGQRDFTFDLLVRDQAVSEYICVCKLLVLKEMVGAKGFEPSTSWSRNRVPKILKALSGVAYETERADFSLSLVPKLYLD